ncbi:MAG: hypothetical protein U9N87_14160, partial [Planctomycetota bacterium]|nr:hypothetical protein [Planctomycetota bacterium]
MTPPQLVDQAQHPDAGQPGFRRAQWRMLLATMFCYLFYYTGRQNWGFVVQALEEDLGLDKLQTGWIAGAMLAAYGLGTAEAGLAGVRVLGLIDELWRSHYGILFVVSSKI